jgi:hypothetical protein
VVPVKKNLSRIARPLILLLALALVVPTRSPVQAQEGGQTVTLELIPVGIEGEVSGAISFRLPPGYEPWGTYPPESAWGPATASWPDYDYHGTRVVQTVTFSDGNQDRRTGDEIDGVGFGGGVLYVREDADIRTEAERSQKPYVEGEIYEEGPTTVSGDGVVYEAYYYLSSRTEEEQGEYEWLYGYHNLALRIALSQTEPLYTLWLHFWTWGPADFTDRQGTDYTFTLDGNPVMDVHGEYLKAMLSSVTITGWKAPAPLAPPARPQTKLTGSDWLDTIPLPTEISTDPQVVGTNVGLALFFALAFGLTSELFNATLKENEESIHARLAPLLAPLRRGKKRLPRLEGGRWTRLAKAMLMLLLSALLYAFLDPGFGLSASGAIVFLSLFVALLVVIYSYDGCQALLGARFYRLGSRFQLFPVALAFGVACVLVTRCMDFHPGYLYGFVAGLGLLGLEAETPRRQALLVLGGVAALLAATLLAWGLAVPMAGLAEGGLPGASIIYGVLVAIFVAGLEGLLFSLVPLAFMDGSKIMAWSRVVWAVTFGLAAWLFFHVLINPGSAYLDALSSKKVLLMGGTLAAYAVLTVGTWLCFRWHGPESEPLPAGPATETIQSKGRAGRR